MKDPIRLLESSPSKLERQMLASMANETVPPELVMRMSSGIGLTLSSGVGLGAAHTVLSEAAASKGALASVGAAAGKTSLAPTAWTLSGLIGTKLTIGVLSTATLVATSVAYFESGDPKITQIPVEPAPAPIFQPMTSVPRVSVSQTRAEAVVPANTEQRRSKAGSPGVIGERSPGKARAAAISPQPASAGHVALEVSLLDQARRAITSGDRPQAMTLLSRYRAKFPNGVLLNEARLLTAAAEAL